MNKFVKKFIIKSKSIYFLTRLIIKTKIVLKKIKTKIYLF